MKVKIVDKQTGQTKEKKVRNIDHFKTQLNNRTQIIESKKKYKRSRDKKITEE